MRVEGGLFLFVFVFLGVCDAVYWFTSYDPTGTTALGLAAGFGFIIGTYLIVTGRRIDPRPEDRGEATIEEGAGEVGFFSPYSWWPMSIALSVGLLGMGWIYGWWLFVIGVALVVLTVGGLLFEYYAESPY
jgi:hypothetical protein